MEALRKFARSLPTLLLAFALALAVWISAVTSTDPLQERTYPGPVDIEIIGQNPALVLTGDVPEMAEVTLQAPSSIWDRIINEQVPVRAILDLSGLQAGGHQVPLQVQVGISPVEIVKWVPEEVSLRLERLSSVTLPINIVKRGSLPVGYQAGSPMLEMDTATISGPLDQVARVQEVRAVVDISSVVASFQRTLPLQAVDASGSVVEGLTISPTHVTFSVEVTQLGGYRNVVVKAVLLGQVASGYRVTNISVYPAAVTVFSADPQLVAALPGYVETLPVDLTGARDDIITPMQLSLPQGVVLVGEQNVEVQVGIASIEGSIKLTDRPVEIIGVSNDMEVVISPASVDVLLSGPLPLLDTLPLRNVRVTIDMTEKGPGTYQVEPKVETGQPEIRVDSILPGTVEVTLIAKGRPSPTPRSP